MIDNVDKYIQDEIKAHFEKLISLEYSVELDNIIRCANNDPNSDIYYDKRSAEERLSKVFSRISTRYNEYNKNNTLSFSNTLELIEINCKFYNESINFIGFIYDDFDNYIDAFLNGISEFVIKDIMEGGEEDEENNGRFTKRARGSMQGSGRPKRHNNRPNNRTNRECWKESLWQYIK